MKIKLSNLSKILPKVSPNKTWEGFWGGVLSSVLFSMILAPFLTPLSHVQACFVGIILAIAGFCGDVTMSAIKRDIGVKDTLQHKAETGTAICFHQLTQLWKTHTQDQHYKEKCNNFIYAKCKCKKNKNYPKRLHSRDKICDIFFHKLQNQRRYVNQSNQDIHNNQADFDVMGQQNMFHLKISKILYHSSLLYF